MAMVIPRSRSSGALSIEANERNWAPPLRARYFVIAAVSVVLPWSMWPMVPTLTCGLVRSNFFLAMPGCLLRPSTRRCDSPLGFLNELAGHGRRNHVVVGELHGVGRPALGRAAQVGGVAEHRGQGHEGADRRRRAPARGSLRVHALDLSTPAVEVADDVSQEFLGEDDLHLHDRLEDDR